MRGIDYICPVVTHERFRENIRVGTMVNLGFLPPDLVNPLIRAEEIDSTRYYEMVGMVTKNRDLDKSVLIKEGNANDEQRFGMKSFNLIDMANFSGLTNKDNLKNSLLERINVDATPLDRSNPQHYDIDLNATTLRPYAKVT